MKMQNTSRGHFFLLLCRQDLVTFYIGTFFLSSKFLKSGCGCKNFIYLIIFILNLNFSLYIYSVNEQKGEDSLNKS